jgi:DNA/RNA endonuclease G (NUC1)
MKKLTSLLLIALIYLPLRAVAWGKQGHQIIAEIGFGMLDENTQREVKKYLGNISVPAAGTWMDDMRNNPKYAYMKPWHYINLEPGDRYRPTDEHNIVSELNRVIEELKHKERLTNVQIQQNLLVLFHLVGDLAQPLHAGYGSDLGGNNAEVTYISKPSNLHKVWDSEIIEGEKISKEECMELFGSLTDEKIDAIRIIDPEAWMKDSRQLLNRIYNFKNDTINRAYVTRNKIVVKRQLLYAGIRLAATLDDLFKAPVKVKATATGTKALKPRTRGLDTVTLEHTWYRSYFVNSAHIPWVVEYTLRATDVNCEDPIKRSDKFAPDPFNVAATDLDKDYAGTGYDRGHNMPAANNGCHGPHAMAECFYFSNMFPQTHRLNAGAWKSLEVQERDLAIEHDSIYVWIGSYGVAKKIGTNKVVVPKYCWKVIYDYKTKEWSAYIFPNTTTVSGKPVDFKTTVADITAKSGFEFR